MDFRLPEAAALAKIVELPEAAKTSSLVDAMVAIDEEMERLKSAQKNGWKGIPNQPDVVPAHTATILWEHFKRAGAHLTIPRSVPKIIARSSLLPRKPLDQLRALLHNANADTAAHDTAFKSLGQTCAACHKPYRN